MCRTGDWETAQGGDSLDLRLYFRNRLRYEVSNERAYCVECGKSFRLSR